MAGFDHTLYRLHLAQERQRLHLGAAGGSLPSQESSGRLDLSFANIVFDPEKHPRLHGKFTFSQQAGKTIATPKFDHPVFKHFEISRQGTTTRMHGMAKDTGRKRLTFEATLSGAPQEERDSLVAHQLEAEGRVARGGLRSHPL